MIDNEEKFREIAKEEMRKAVIMNVNSALIFQYIDHLEKRVKELEELLK